ncbi:arylesterase [Aquabacterium sp. J223]|uniref:arylesterase n=1 Tax=Aquabacterium sp. J223 TaxID=2898431 RepID=UPI0021AE28B7|nr:arylesterase [Aquabacterium sp. J223]UUX97242.1 arylesterase [Aquabacterium sp. J223]
MDTLPSCLPHPAAGWTRRRWLAHCSVAGLALAGARPQAAAGPARILVVGDSLSAEYGLARGSGWVALLEQRLAQTKTPASVVNASISGDTTAGGRARLPALLKQHQPTHVVIELGGNDALRGLPLAGTEDNLAAMARAAREAGARVLLLGMQLPPNYGRRYGEDFAALYAKVAKSQQAALVPFFLKGVADVADAERYFQPDRIHPREIAQAKMLDNVWPALQALLGRT